MFEVYIGGIALLILVVAGAWMLLRGRPVLPWQTGLFFAVASGGILALRWHGITWLHEIQVDESQMLAQALRFFGHPIPWRDVDGITGGPLDSMLLALPLFLKIPASWKTARIILWMCNGATLVFLYRGLRSFTSGATALVAILPAAIFYAFATHPDFIHYSSETLPDVLLAICFCYLMEQWAVKDQPLARSFLVAFFGVAIAFAKLQAAPMGLFLSGMSLYLLLRHCSHAPGGPRSSHRKIIAWLSGAAILPVFLGCMLAMTGALGQFWKSYILLSISYTGSESFLDKEINLERVMFIPSDFHFYFYTTAAAVALIPIVWLARKQNISLKIIWPAVIASVESFLAFGVILAAGKDYFHYALLLVPGFTMLFGAILYAGQVLLQPANLEDSGSIIGGKIWNGMFVIITIGTLTASASSYCKNEMEFAALRRRCPPGGSLVSREILRAKEPGDTMTVWGWMPAYHVETQIAPATRMILGDATISVSPRRNYGRALYMEDLRQNRPAFFVDAIAGNTFQWYWNNPDTHEKFPELNRFITNSYLLWLKIYKTNEAATGLPVRIYVRKDRMEKLRLLPQDLRTAADPFYGPP